MTQFLFHMTEIPVNNAMSVKVIESERDLWDVFQRHVLIKVPINMKKWFHISSNQILHHLWTHQTYLNQLKFHINAEKNAEVNFINKFLTLFLIQLNIFYLSSFLNVTCTRFHEIHPYTYQIYFSWGLKRVKQVHNERTFTESQSISLSFHLISHVLIHHVCFLHHLPDKSSILLINDNNFKMVKTN